MWYKNTKPSFTTGFTLIELLVVISIIGLLSSVVLASLNSARLKARDARRQSDMQEIYTALIQYYDTYNCLPITVGSTCGVASGTYSEGNGGGWDYSSQGGFMTFLKTAGFFTNVPVDPVNNTPSDPRAAGTYSYRYYCYTGGGGNFGLRLSYWSEVTGLEVVKSQPPGGGWADSSFVCQ